MYSTLNSFSSLYAAALLMLCGSGLFNTFMGLRLTAQSVSAFWVGLLIAGYYFGLVCGARLGHKLLIRVGHIRAFVACAAISATMVLAQASFEVLPLWLVLRLIAGIAMVTQFMVLESWLNEQTENRLRGRVFSVYMLVSGLGTVLGQLSLTMYGTLDLRPLTLVAIFQVLCLVPIALTARSHPATPVPAPLDIKFFAKRVPLSLTVLFMAGNLSGAFYGLVPVYAARHGMSTSQVAVFVAASVTAGLLSQFPMGWLSDRINRARLIRCNALILAVFTTVMWGWLDLPYWLMLTLSCVFGVLQFTLYPLGAAFANDHVEADKRVGLSAILLMAYGIGACIGPLIAGALMSLAGPNMYYVFVSACAVILVWRVRPARVTGEHQVDAAPVHFVPMPDTLQSSPAAVATLDPRVDPAVDQTLEMVEPDASAATQPARTEGATEGAAEGATGGATGGAVAGDVDGHLVGSRAANMGGPATAVGSDATTAGPEAGVVTGTAESPDPASGRGARPPSL